MFSSKCSQDILRIIRVYRLPEREVGKSDPLSASASRDPRCIFKINPDKGSKVQRQEKKKSNAVNPKVLTLINRIAEFDWST